MASPVTIQPDAAAGKDAQMVSSAATTNYGTGTTLYVGDGSSSVSEIRRSLVQLPWAANIPAGAVITAVSLYLWEDFAATSGGGIASRAVELRNVLRDWVEAEATYNEFSTGNAWGTAGCGNASDRDATVLATVTLDGTAANAFVEWSGAGLTAFVQAIIDGTATDDGLLVSAPTAESQGTVPTAANRFCSSDHATAAQRPKAIVAYTLLPTVTTAAVSGVHGSAAACGGNVTVDGVPSVTAKGVCWSTTTLPTIADSKTVDGTGAGAFTSAITGLLPATAYHVSAYATNGAGTTYGAEVDFMSADYYVSTGTRFAGGSGGIVVKVDGQDFTLDPGPFQVTGVQFGGSMPGGHGRASFDVPVSSAYLAPFHVLKVGAWVEMNDADHRLYEGEILSVKRVVDLAGGLHKFSVLVGGLGEVAAKRGDVSKTWVTPGGQAFKQAPGTNKAGEYFTDPLELMVREGAGENFHSPRMVVWYFLDDGLSDEEISSIDYTVEWDVTDEGQGAQWMWSMESGNLATMQFASVLFSERNTSSAGSSGTITPVAGQNVLALNLGCSRGAHTVDSNKFVRFTKLDVFSSGRTTKPRVDEAMVDLATRPGLATSFVSLPVGLTYDDLRVAKVSAAKGEADLATLHAQPFDHAFWDDRTYYCRPLERVPSNPADVIVVGGGNPGLVSWDVDENAEARPDYVRVLFGNHDDVTLPEGFVRALYAPATPPDTADLTIPTVDLSGTILADSAAMAAAANELGAGSGVEMPQGAVFDVHPEMAKSSLVAGNNADPTSAYAQTLPDAATGALTYFAYTPASGWAGTNSPADPTCLVFDPALSNQVTWGDFALCDFGTGPFSVAVWFKLNATGWAHTLFRKYISDATLQGWRLVVTDTDTLVAEVCETRVGSKYQRVGCETPLALGVWYHAGLTYAGTGGVLKLYLNGQPADTFYSLTTDDLDGGTSNAGSLKLGAAA